MKKIIRILLYVLIVGTSFVNGHAESPYTTWAMGPWGRLILTQDAYTPIDEIALPIANAQDMFVTQQGDIYIADTGNGRIARYVNFQEIASYGEGTLQGPTGIFVDPEGVMYVVDGKSNAVFILDQNGGVISQFGRPSEPLFGINREFLPRKIAVDARQNLYIVSEGSVNGIVQMNTAGNFIGYFGANTATMSLKMILQRMFLTQEQLDQFIKNEAASPTNLTIDHQSMVYTITAGTDRFRSIRKFTVSGRNIMPETFGSASFRDIDVSEDGLAIAVDANGQIYEYDTNGNLLFVFGAQDRGDQRIGTLRNPTAIERYQEYLYVLDSDKNAIITYRTTSFAREVHEGIRLYMDGFYSEAKPYFEEVLNYNGSFIMAYQAIADAYFKERDFSNALIYYRYAEDQHGYSQAFWELRNEILQKYLSGVIIGLLGLSVAQNIFSRIERKYKWLDPLRRWFKDLKNHKLIDDFVFMFRFIRYPADSFYYIKKNLRGSLRFAWIIYAWVIVVRVASLHVTGFIFNKYTSTAQIRVENEILITLLLMFLWNAANYLVSTISDGEGRVRDVMIGSAYSLFPYALFALPVALLSNLLTLNEIFIYSFSMDLIWFWVGLMLFLMVKEIHNYSFSETIRNIFVTIFTMALFVLTGYILYVLFNQLFDFLTAILQEIRIRG
jgi:tetratricopeptide (TPR) repeat protein